MALRYHFVSNEQSTPRMHCPECGFTGRGWQKFPKPSLCGKIWCGILSLCCCCCLPLACNCSIKWEWMCPACHHLHSEDEREILLLE